MQPHQNVKKCWFFVVLLGLGCVGGVHTISSVSGERYTGPVVMVIDLVGQKQCIQKCLERPSVCKGVNYSRQNLLCELVSATEKTELRPEYVRVTLDVTDLANSQCPMCPLDEVCVILSSNKSHCIKDDRGPFDCTSIHTSNPSDLTGLYTIGLPVFGHVSVYCDMETDGGGWTVFQRRLDGSEDFDRTWEEYKIGFGDITSEFWLGNDKLHYLLSQGKYELRFDMEDSDNQPHYVKYSSFSVGDEASKYTVSISGYTGNVGDCFTNTIQFMKFSTKDQDNDAFDGHCAVSYNSGWWYNNCHCANPNGLFGQGMTYRHWHTQTYFLKSTKLMVRRNVQQNREALLQVHESVEVPFNPDY
uniref:Ficolin-2-like n=1 Tax=Crassostrea virginica TaxID=6565 RepID=A0A8B8C0J8_CRAVI|nr:ficolin-2-like [Crassostrea virginica]